MQNERGIWAPGLDNTRLNFLDNPDGTRYAFLENGGKIIVDHDGRPIRAEILDGAENKYITSYAGATSSTERYDAANNQTGMESLGADGSSRLTEFDPLDRAPWTTLTSTFDRNGEQTGVFREFDDPDRWLAQHILNMNHLAGYDEPAAENLIASIEREAIRGPALDEGLPSPISYEPRFGSAYDFSEGDFNLDWDPHEGSADVDLSGDLNGWDDSWADSWEDIDWGDEDNDWGGDDTDWGGWGDFFPTDYDIGSWEGGDWGPVVIDLNGDGVDIVAREDSPVYFNLDGDAALEKTAWAGRTAPA